MTSVHMDGRKKKKLGVAVPMIGVAVSLSCIEADSVS